MLNFLSSIESKQQFMFEYAQKCLRVYNKYVSDQELEDCIEELLCMSLEEFITPPPQYIDGQFSVATSLTSRANSEEWVNNSDQPHPEDEPRPQEVTEESLSKEKVSSSPVATQKEEEPVENEAGHLQKEAEPPIEDSSEESDPNLLPVTPPMMPPPFQYPPMFPMMMATPYPMPHMYYPMHYGMPPMMMMPRPLIPPMPHPPLDLPTSQPSSPEEHQPTSLMATPTTTNSQPEVSLATSTSEIKTTPTVSVEAVPTTTTSADLQANNESNESESTQVVSEKSNKDDVNTSEGNRKVSRKQEEEGRRYRGNRRYYGNRSYETNKSRKNYVNHIHQPSHK